VLPVDLPFWPPRQRFLQADTAFHPGQSRAQAEVDAIAEGDMEVDRAVDVRRSGRAYLRSSRAAEPVRRTAFEPTGMVTPCTLTSWATHRA
jgi:hypothetical protein